MSGVLAVLLSSGANAAVAAADPPGPAFFISPGGNDANAGISSADPFATLERARSAMRRSSIKTAYLLAGAYRRRSALKLDQDDDGESWLAYPGQTPVLDGNKTAKVAFEVGGDDITIRWLTIQNFTECGIKGSDVSGLFVDSNHIRDIVSPAWGMSPLEFGGSIKRGRITHNLIERTGYSGIEINADAGDDISGLLIDMNVVHESCLTTNDCGGIYVMDRSHASRGVTITNNIIGDFGTARVDQGVGIYLDDEASNVTVTHNIVYGTGNWALQIHGGDHNAFTNNIFDVSKAQGLGLYQDISSSDAVPRLSNFGMGGNTFRCNIVYSSSRLPSPLWTYINEGTTPIEDPSVSANVYWGRGGFFSNAGVILDSSPAVSDPKFIAPTKADYRFRSGPPTSCAFDPIDATHAGPLPH